MTKYRLNSIDWNTVRLLHGEHLSYETRYLEELVRWGLSVTSRWGVVEMHSGNLIVSSSPTDFEARLTWLRAVSPLGFWIEVNETILLQDVNAQYTDLEIPIYVGIQTSKRSVPIAAAQTRALVEVNALQTEYFLTTRPPSHARDYLQIGRLIKQGTQFVLDDNYIPPCVYLSSHPALIKAVGQIKNQASEAAQSLRKYAGSDFKFSHTLAASMAAQLAPLETLMDWRQSPHAYLEGVGRTLRQLHQLIQPLKKLDLSSWKDAENALREAWEEFVKNGELPNENPPLHLLCSKAANALRQLIPLLRELREPPPEYVRKEPETRFDNTEILKQVDPKPAKGT